MSDRVLVVLDRKEAAQLRVMVRHETGCRYMANDRHPCGCLRGRLFAALDRDREELAAVIDPAVDTALTAMWGDGYEGVEDDVREAIWAAAPLLVEHGRRQELGRIKQIIEDRAERAVGERKSEQYAYLSGRRDALVALAYELGQEGTIARISERLMWEDEIVEEALHAD